MDTDVFTQITTKTVQTQYIHSLSVHATLAIGKGVEGDTGLSASGMFVINPPFTLAEQLRAALAVVGPALARGNGKGWQVEAGGA